MPLASRLSAIVGIPGTLGGHRRRGHTKVNEHLRRVTRAAELKRARHSGGEPGCRRRHPWTTEWEAPVGIEPYIARWTEAKHGNADSQMISQQRLLAEQVAVHDSDDDLQAPITC